MSIEKEFWLVLCPEQDPMTGEIAPKFNGKLRNTRYFSQKVDMSIDSPLKTTINEICQELLAGYDLGKPRLIGDLKKIKSQLVFLVRIDLELDSDESPIEEATITDHECEGIRFCSPFYGPRAWYHSRFGEKKRVIDMLRKQNRSRRKNFNSLGDKFAQAKKAAVKNGDSDIAVNE